MSVRTYIPLMTFVGGAVFGVILSILFFLQKEPPESVVHVTESSSYVRSVDLMPPSIRRSIPKQFDLDNMESKKFLFSEFVPSRKPVRLEHPSHLRQEYKLRKTVFIGVLTSQMYLPTRAKAIYDTWASDVSMLVFFVGEDCIVPRDLIHLPIIKLKKVPDSVYPPLKKAFAVMQYMYDHFVNDYDWFIRADDDVYMRGRKLMDLLNTMDPNDIISLGRAGEGRVNAMDRLQLLKHERYCMGGPGMVFSRGTMQALGPYLNLCLEASKLLL